MSAIFNKMIKQIVDLIEHLEDKEEYNEYMTILEKASKELN